MKPTPPLAYLHNNELHRNAYGGKAFSFGSSEPDRARPQSGSKPLKTAHFRAWSLAVAGASSVHAASPAV